MALHPPDHNRNVTIDVLRGVALVIMAVDHLPHNCLAALFNSLGPFGLFSANTAFLFLSGIVSGFVYGAVRIKRGSMAMLEKAIHRARQIYFVQIGLFLAIGVAGFHSTSFQLAHAYFYHHPWTCMAMGMVFLYQFQFLGILPLYCFFILLMPFAIVQFQRRRSWLVLAPSAAFWLLAQFGVPSWAPGWDDPLFFLNPFACQAVFFVGLYFGCRRKASADVQSPSASKVLLWVCGLMAGVFFATRMFAAFTPYLDALMTRLARLVDIQTQGPVRLLSFAVVAYLTWRLQFKLRHFFERNSLARLLAFLGRHSLQVFAWSVLLSSGLQMFLPPHVSRLSGRIETALVLASLVIPAWLHSKYQGRARFVSSAPLVQVPG
jgi:hypothetical protein